MNTGPHYFGLRGQNTKHKRAYQKSEVVSVVTWLVRRCVLTGGLPNRALKADFPASALPSALKAVSTSPSPGDSSGKKKTGERSQVMGALGRGAVMMKRRRKAPNPTQKDDCPFVSGQICTRRMFNVETGRRHRWSLTNQVTTDKSQNPCAAAHWRKPCAADRRYVRVRARDRKL